MAASKLLLLEALPREKNITLSRHTIYRLVKAGKFPRPRRLGGHRIVFVEAEIDEWIANLPEAEPRVRRAKQKEVSDANR